MASADRLQRPIGAMPWHVLAEARHARPVSLNRPVGHHRSLEALTLDLAKVKAAAHRHGGKINDVVLALAAGGVRRLLLARSERVDGVYLHASVAISLRHAAERDGIGNRAGGMAVRLPLDPDPHLRLRRIAHECAGAKTQQPPTAGNTLLVWLARIGLLRRFSRHQHVVNVVESNVAGPAQPVALLGVPITGIVPVGVLVGNLSLSFLALSYAGQLTIAVQADADQHPDLPVLMSAMGREAQELLALPATVAAPTAR